MLELPTSHQQCWQGEVAPPSPGSSLGLWPPAAGAEDTHEDAQSRAWTLVVRAQPSTPRF